MQTGQEYDLQAADETCGLCRKLIENDGFHAFDARVRKSYPNIGQGIPEELTIGGAGRRRFLR